MSVSPERVRYLNTQAPGAGPVVYWMQRDQRAEDNWALLYAQAQATERQVQLAVVFSVPPTFGDTTQRQHDFMLQGLQQTAADLARRNIPFILLTGDPEHTIPDFAAEQSVGELVVDFNPLRFTNQWRQTIAKRVSVRVTEVDAHNIIPCWQASKKQEYAAYTFRPRVHRQLATYLTEFPALHNQVLGGPIQSPTIDWEQERTNTAYDQSVPAVDWLTPGTQAAKLRVRDFIAQQLDTYAEARNDPNQQAVSHLSPYLHFGQLSAQWVARAVQRATETSKASRDAFLEELIVRRELTDNYCYYNPEYDSVSGAHAWAQKTIAEHANDEREYTYERKQLEFAQTHDELWNAFQRQLVLEGKMHGWGRMYWAKKILEWSDHAQLAVDRALYLNDRYELDGTDPNGIVGVMWSICGVHDRAWNERPVFGKIRYMNYAGAKRKFDVAAFCEKYPPTKSMFNE